MIRDGKYRYTIQFGMETEAEKQAGTFLERLGNRKSPVIIAAINEYLQNHPELSSSQGNVQFNISGVDPRMLEIKIRKLIEERLGSGVPLPAQEDQNTPATAKQVSNDILDMLSDLDCFS